MIRQWLTDCDERHTQCRQTTPLSLPTRLIDVGSQGSAQVWLWETQGANPVEYIVLSHPWGEQRPGYAHFCTTPKTLESHKSGIELLRLPPTFKDAVIVTRTLGYRYLWIDSLCIVQGPHGDFNLEAPRMENVFSSATCVIAATRATGQWDGFLAPRGDRAYVSVGPGKQLHICEAIDDFNGHVLEAQLNSRGWVLQERALARRTVYFTSKQLYWECGAGVRCETLTKMHKWVFFTGWTAYLPANSSSRQSSGSVTGRPEFPSHSHGCQQGRENPQVPRSLPPVLPASLLSSRGPTGSHYGPGKKASRSPQHAREAGSVR